MHVRMIILFRLCVNYDDDNDDDDDDDDGEVHEQQSHSHSCPRDSFWERLMLVKYLLFHHHRREFGFAYLHRTAAHLVA
jgi:hypothetical protein